MDGSRTHDGAVPTRGITLDEATLDAFVRTHHARLTGLARLVCRDSTDAGDAVQSAFEQAWRHRGSLREPDALRAWLDRIVVREAIRQDRVTVVAQPLSWLTTATLAAELLVVDPIREVIGDRFARHGAGAIDGRGADLAKSARRA